MEPGGIPKFRGEEVMEHGGAAAEGAEDECGHISTDLTTQVTVIDSICVSQIIDLFPRGNCSVVHCGLKGLKLTT